MQPAPGLIKICYDTEEIEELTARANALVEVAKQKVIRETREVLEACASAWKKIRAEARDAIWIDADYVPDVFLPLDDDGSTNEVRKRGFVPESPPPTGQKQKKQRTTESLDEIESDPVETQEQEQEQNTQGVEAETSAPEPESGKQTEEENNDYHTEVPPTPGYEEDPPGAEILFANKNEDAERNDAGSDPDATDFQLESTSPDRAFGSIITPYSSTSSSSDKVSSAPDAAPTSSATSLMVTTTAVDPPPIDQAEYREYMKSYVKESWCPPLGMCHKCLYLNNPGVYDKIAKKHYGLRLPTNAQGVARFEIDHTCKTCNLQFITCDLKLCPCQQTGRLYFCAKPLQQSSVYTRYSPCRHNIPPDKFTIILPYRGPGSIQSNICQVIGDHISKLAMENSSEHRLKLALDIKDLTETLREWGHKSIAWRRKPVGALVIFYDNTYVPQFVIGSTENLMENSTKRMNSMMQKLVRFQEELFHGSRPILLNLMRASLDRHIENVESARNTVLSKTGNLNEWRQINRFIRFMRSYRANFGNEQLIHIVASVLREILRIARKMVAQLIPAEWAREAERFCEKMNFHAIDEDARAN